MVKFIQIEGMIGYDLSEFGITSFTLKCENRY